MTNVLHIGEYVKIKNVFYSQSLESDYIKYTICSRKQPTKEKPQNYIVAKIKGKDYYLSSMYPTTNPNVFRIEYKGIINHLTIKDNVITVN